MKITDAAFHNPLKLERRPHISIDPCTGTVSSSAGSGQRFDIEYVGTGSEFSFDIYLYAESEKKDFSGELDKILAAMKAGELRFGAKKSTGSGKVQLKRVERDIYYLRKEKDRIAWIQDAPSHHCGDYMSKLPEYVSEEIAYQVTLTGKTTGAIQVRGLAVLNFGKDAPDSENMRNANDEYIVPGSSLKGVLRSRMQMIADYKGCSALTAQCFGTANEAGKNGLQGNLLFSDMIIGTKEKNDAVQMRSRIHIDKFTGGVISRSLFSEKNAYGRVVFTVDVKKKHNPDASLGLLLYALRDLAAGQLSIGNGYSTGKGFIDVSKIEIRRIRDGKTALLEPLEGKIIDESGIITAALQSVEKGA